MIELRGKISVQRISGSINVVPTSGSPPLQGKVVIPNHDEQLIKPDDEYYGLSVVTVAAVPRIPFAVPSATYDKDHICNRIVNIVMETSAEELSGIQYYYNHELLGEIPADLEKTYPYVIMLRSATSIEVLFCKEKPYCTEDTSGTCLYVPSGGIVWFQYRSEVNGWLVKQTQTSGTFEYVKGPPTLVDTVVWWSNFNIPIGQTDVTGTFFPASEPKAEPTEKSGFCMYNGVRLPEIPADVLATHPYAWIRQRSGYYNLYLSVGAWYGNSSSVYHNDSEAIKHYRISVADVETATEWIYETDMTSSYIATSGVLWFDRNIPQNSPTATSWQFLGTPAVPIE